MKGFFRASSGSIVVWGLRLFFLGGGWGKGVVRDHTSLHRPYEILITGGPSTLLPLLPLRVPMLKGFL